MIQTTCKIDIHKKGKDDFYFLGVTVDLPNGEKKYFCDMLTKSMAEKLSTDLNLPITTN